MRKRTPQTAGPLQDKQPFLQWIHCKNVEWRARGDRETGTERHREMGEEIDRDRDRETRHRQTQRDRDRQRQRHRQRQTERHTYTERQKETERHKEMGEDTGGGRRRETDERERNGGENYTLKSLYINLYVKLTLRSVALIWILILGVGTVLGMETNGGHVSPPNGKSCELAFPGQGWQATVEFTGLVNAYVTGTG